MQPTLARLDHVRLALDQGIHHLRYLLQPAQHDLVPLDKPIALILDANVLAELPDQHLQSSQIVPRHPGEQVVDGLELQASVQEVQPRRTIDIHGGSKLALGEGLCGAEIRRRGSPVGESDLHVQEQSDGVRDEDERNTSGPVRESLEKQMVPENVPVAGHHDEFDVASPPCGSKGGGARREKMQPGEEVEVEAGDAHDGIVGVFLVRDEEIGGTIPNEGEVVEGAPD